MIEDDFTRPRTRDLELADEEDEEEEQFPGFSGDEERELVRPSDYGLFLFFFIPLVDFSGYRRGRHSGARRATLIQCRRT